jgi:tetratricopeptide (TPR) repeat protein
LTNQEEEIGMKVRLGLVLAAAALFAGSGCAAGGSGGESSAPSGPTLPGGQVLEEGIRPRDNSHTRSADLNLTRAQASQDEVEAQQYFQEAMQASLDGITADPENPKSYFQGGQAAVGIGDFVAADSLFDRAEELHPRYILETESWRERGWVEAYNEAIVPMNAGELETARDLFQGAVDLYGGRPEAHLQLGSIKGRLDDVDGAVAAFQEAISILEGTKETQLADTATADIWQQHWEIATSSLGQTLVFGERYQEAADLYTSLLAERPDDVSLVGNLANALSQLNMPDSVQALYDQLMGREDLTERELFNAGVGLYQIENYQQAAMAFRRAAEMNPYNRDARLNLAQTLSIGEEFEALIPAARDLLEVDPRNALGWIFLTRALSETDQTEEANAVFTEYQEIGWEVSDLSLTPDPDGGARLSGAVKNTAVEPGTAITLRFHFGGESGQEVGTLDIQLQAPDLEMSEFFQGEFVSNELVTGYTYEVIAP